MRHQERLFALAHIAAPDARLWNRQPFAPGGNRDTCVERIPLMNPADVAQSAIPLVGADVSLIDLFSAAKRRGLQVVKRGAPLTKVDSSPDSCTV